MTVLGCDVSSCYYNESKKCCKGDIEVGGYNAENASSTCCSSFRENSGASNCSCCSSPKDKIAISCDAVKCVYNEDKNCVAGNIMVSGGDACNSEETLCASFKAR